MHKKNLVILGSTSFIGKHLFKKFKGKYIVHGFGSKDIDLIKKNEISKLKKYINSETIVLILSANKLQKNASIDVLNQNFQMYSNLINLFNSYEPKKVIFFSSQVVFGEYINNNRTKERTKQNPNTYYGLSKIIGEKLIEFRFKNHKSKYVIIRMPRIYGPNDSINNYGPTQFVYNHLKKIPIKIWGDGKELREFIHINDIVNIIEIIISTNINGLLNISSGKAHRFIDIIKSIEKITNKRVKYFHAQRTGKSVNHIFDNSHFIRKFPKYKFININEGIKQLLKDNKFKIK